MSSSKSKRSGNSEKGDGGRNAQKRVQAHIERVFLNTSSNIIASGSNGMIVANELEPGVVLKMIYSSSATGKINNDCHTWKDEQRLGRNVYAGFERIPRDHGAIYVIPQPLRGGLPSGFAFRGQRFDCAFPLTRMVNLKEGLLSKPGVMPRSVIEESVPDHLLHVVNGDGGTINGIVGKNGKKPISDLNPPRGFFCMYDWLESNVLSVLRRYGVQGAFDTADDWLWHLGYSYGILFFGVEIFPWDVEWVLCWSPEDGCAAMGVLDFGMGEIYSRTFQAMGETMHDNGGDMKRVLSDLSEMRDPTLNIQGTPSHVASATILDSITEIAGKHMFRIEYIPTDTDRKEIFIGGLRTALEDSCSYRPGEKRMNQGKRLWMKIAESFMREASPSSD